MKEKKIVLTERVFDAPREKVWQAWTEPEQIKKWWGPEGFTAPSIRSDFKVGGKYVYCMHGPEGSEWDKDMYSGGEFLEIVTMEKIVSTDYFCDEDGNKLSPSDFAQPEGFPDESVATVLFEDAGDGKTKVTIISHIPDDPAVEKALKDSGAAQGWASSLNKLAEVLAN